MRFTTAIVCLALCAVPEVHASANGTRAFDVRDLIAFDRLSEPRVSPDGRSIVVTISSLDLEANRRRSDLWLAHVDGTGLRQVMSGADQPKSPTWSADGKQIAFYDATGIYILDVATRKVYQVSDSRGYGGFDWK